MFDFKLPTEGLTITHDRPTKKDDQRKVVPQIIQLNLVENATKDILRCIRNNEQVRLKLGPKPAIQYGRKHFHLNHGTESFTSEIFKGPLDTAEPMYFSGRLSHTLEVQKAKQDTAKSDEALTALENNLKSMKAQQASNEVVLMTSNKSDSKKKDGKTPTLSARDRLRGAATPSSPFLGASPRLGPTSNPLQPSLPSKEKIRQEAIRKPLVHLLAMSPMTAENVAQRLNASQSDCDKVLEKVAKDGSGGNKELKEKCFRELDVWKFPYQTSNDRDAAIKRAIHAYDRMRIDKNDPIWQQLLPYEDRGKGTTLSRLNFNPLPTVSTPRQMPEVESKAEASDREGKSKKVKPAKESKESSHKKKLSGDSIAKKKPEKTTAKSTASNVKADGKYKSSERIEDSDEEAQSVEVAPAKPRATKPKERERDSRIGQSPRNVPNMSTNGQHKSKLSNSSSSSSDLEKVRPYEDRTKLKARPHGETSPSKSRISPRPRVDSLSQKPSPLGSSPPTNSTDLENSSKSSVQSSAPSSPPSSTDMPLSQARKNYSPVIAGKGRNSTNQPKRKADKGGEPAPKRQQIHGLGLSKTVTEKIRQQPTPERRGSGSSLSSPEKQPVTKETVVDATLKFREYYARYKDLHARLEKADPDERADRDLDQLWRMHERLEKIKEDLWSDWRKAGGEVPV